MNENMEKLEEICDEVAAAIDSREGRITRSQVNELIANSLEEYGFTTEQFNEMFENIYLCSVNQYISNSIDDAEYDASHSGDFPIIDDMEDLAFGDEFSGSRLLEDEGWD